MIIRMLAVSLALTFLSAEVEAGERSRSSTFFNSPSAYKQANVFKYPGLTYTAAPYSVVSRGLYKTGRHGGYYGPRNGGPLPQQ